jgi:co-chaperonin GroES (HSP10)
MLHARHNKLVVKVKTKYHKDFGNMIKRANLNPGSQINPADYVQIMGEVVSVPEFISTRRDYKGYTADDIYPGDTAIFRYDVIYDLVQQEPDAEPIYKNMVWFKGEEYFLADIQKVFGVIRAGEIIMVNGYCMLEEMSNPLGLILPLYLKNLIQGATAKLTHIGRNLSHLKPISAQPGDTVFYDPRILQTYEINNKKFGIIQQSRILGTKTASYADIHDHQLGSSGS